MGILFLIFCMTSVGAINQMPTDHYSFTIENESESWHEVILVSKPTIAANGTTGAFDVSEIWKLEYHYEGYHPDSCLRVIIRDREGYLMSYYLICDQESSEGIILYRGAKKCISLDVFGGRLKSWNISIFEKREGNQK